MWQTQTNNQKSAEKPNLAEQEVIENPMSEIYLNIAQYEKFYRYSMIQSKESVTSSALSEAISMYALFDYLSEQGIELSEEKKQLQLKLLTEQLTYDLQDPQLKSYYDKMFATLQITEQDYIEQYLFLNKKHDILKDEMFKTGNGLTDDGTGFMSYPSGEQEEKFKQKIGIPFDYLEYITLQNSAQLQPLQPLEPQPEFIKGEHHFEFAKNKDGELIFTTPEFNDMYFTEAQNELAYQIRADNKLEHLSRVNFHLYQQHLEQLAKESGPQQETAQEMLELFAIAERTLEWDFGQPVAYHFNELPTFDKSTFRKHKDITLKLYEHNFYYRSERIPQPFYAYRVANEQMVEMYGLFNYLAQNFDVTLDEKTYATLRAQEQQSINEQMQDPYFKSYMEQLLAKFELTLDQYMDDYVMVLAEYNYLKNLMQQQWIGLDHNGRYNNGEVYASYRNTADFTWEAMHAEMDRLNSEVAIEILEPQPELPFDLAEYPLTVGLNAKGEYVFTSVGGLTAYLTVPQQQFLQQLITNNTLPPLTRYSLEQYEAALQQPTTDTNMREQLQEILKIYKNSINTAL